MSKKNQDKYACPYNEGVCCYTVDRKTKKPIFRDCERCGWNPEVAKSRLDKITERRKSVEGGSANG